MGQIILFELKHFLDYCNTETIHNLYRELLVKLRSKFQTNSKIVFNNKKVISTDNQL